MPESEELASIGRRGTVIEFLQLPCPFTKSSVPTMEILLKYHPTFIISHSIAPVEMNGRMFYRAKHFDVRNWWIDDVFRYF